MPDFSQNFNRYSYALNNPLRYNDPNGEFFWLAFGIGFAVGYTAHGVASGDWGIPALATGVMVGMTANSIATSFVGAAWSSNFTGASMWSSVVKDMATMAIGMVTPSINVPIGNSEFSLGLNPWASFLASTSPLGGISAGAGLSINYRGKHFAASFGFSLSPNGFDNFNGGAAFIDGDRVYSYHHTMYMQGGKQRTGTFGYRNGDHFSLQWENDAWAIDGDRYRSNAVEIGFGRTVVGTNVYTTEPTSNNTSFNDADKVSIYSMGNKGTHKDGKTLSSPFYIGRRSKSPNGSVLRVGWDNPYIGDAIQNGIHKFIIPTPFFKQGDFNTPYIHYTTQRPYTLY
jgi:hypothetical protein